MYKEIRNKDDVKEKLINMIINIESEHRRFQTDIYAYYESVTGNVRLEEYVNIGGNSYRADNHYVIWTEEPCYDDDIEIMCHCYRYMPEFIINALSAYGIDTEEFKRNWKSWIDEKYVDYLADSEMSLMDYLRDTCEYDDVFARMYKDFLETIHGTNWHIDESITNMEKWLNE